MLVEFGKMADVFAIVVMTSLAGYMSSALEFEFNADFVEDSGAANRIVAGEYLRTISQELPAAVCFLHNDVNVAEATELLSDSIEKFELLSLALLNGNQDLGIVGAEARRKTIVKIENLITNWEPVRDAATAVLATPSDADAVAIVYASTKPMYDMTYQLLVHLEGEYANPAEILQSDVMLIETAGRMAAMTQIMAYDACRVWSGTGSEDLVADLERTMQTFQASMLALRNGLPQLGILAAPTPEIAGALDAISADWDVISGELNLVIAAEDVTVAVMEDLYHRLAEKLYKAEEISVLYQDYSKRVIN